MPIPIGYISSFLLLAWPTGFITIDNFWANAFKFC